MAPGTYILCIHTTGEISRHSSRLPFPPMATPILPQQLCSPRAPPPCIYLHSRRGRMTAMTCFKLRVPGRGIATSVIYVLSTTYASIIYQHALSPLLVRPNNLNTRRETAGSCHISSISDFDADCTYNNRPAMILSATLDTCPPPPSPPRPPSLQCLCGKYRPK